jgi:hypothetical protein
VGAAVALPARSRLTPRPWYVVRVLGVTSFRRRGVFPGALAMDAPVTILTAGEAIIGPVIEASFIATFAQRFFGAK